MTPKVGTIIISLLGVFKSAFYVLFFFFGKETLLKIGVDENTSELITHVYAVVGILLFSVNILLLIAAIIYSEALILLFLWVVIFYFLIDFSIVLYLCLKFSFGDKALTGLFVLLVSVTYWLFIYVFVIPVVNGFRRSIHTVVIVLT